MSYEELRQRAKANGKAAFGEGWNIDTWAIAPGRIELIGNHTDYNGGPVLAAAIDKVIVLAAGPNDDPRSISVIANDVSESVDTFSPIGLGDWHASDNEDGPVLYVKGVVAALAGRKIPLRSGVCLSYAGDIPPGFGMSSSAAFCLATILALTADEIEPRKMVEIAREAEHRCGSPVGAMDQSASVTGEVIRFDGRDDSFETIEPSMDGLVFAVATSGVDRSLRASSYGDRVKESESAREQIAAAYELDLPNLAAIAERWHEIEPTIGDHLDATLVKRARHVATETIRVNQADEAVRDGCWERFGELMNASGDSSANDYEISHPVVEELVHLLREQSGVLGARMMGGGEGGPALVLLREDAVERVRLSLEPFYERHPHEDGADPFQVCSFTRGAYRERG